MRVNPTYPSGRSKSAVQVAEALKLGLPFWVRSSLSSQCHSSETDGAAQFRLDSWHTRVFSESAVSGPAIYAAGQVAPLAR